MRGKLIVFEGINGSGKTTLINLFLKKYKDNLNIKYFKYPNRNTKTGIKIDKFLKNEIELSLDESLKLFISNILENVEQIEKLLNNGYNIICDRYVISTIVYNYNEIISRKIHNSIDNNIISNIVKSLNGLPKPDLVILINGNHINNRKEDIKERYHQSNNIYNIYINVLNSLNEKYLIINNDDFNKTDNNINEITNKFISLIYSININYY